MRATRNLAEEPHLLINGMYANSYVGTGTWTRALAGVLPRSRVWVPKFDPTDPRRSSFFRKVGFEYQFRWRPAGVRLHPYWAASPDENCVVSILDFIESGSHNPIHRRLLWETAAKALALLTISTAVGREVQERVGRPVLVAAPHPDKEFFQPLTEFTRPLPRGRRLRIGYWGGWASRKMISDAIRTLERSSWADRIELVYIGAHGRAAGLNSRALVPPVTPSELVSMVDSIDIALYPSSDEGFGLPVYESLLRGKPIIVQDLPPYLEFLARPEGSLHYADPLSCSSMERALADAAACIDTPEAVRRALRWPELEDARAQLKSSLWNIPAIRRGIA